VGGEVFYPSAGDSYFLHTGKSHCYFSNEEHPWKKHFINLSGKLLESLTDAYGLGNVSYFEGLDTSDELRRIIELGKSGVDDCSAELIGIINEIFLKMHNHVKEKSENRGIEAEMKDFLNTQITSKFHIELLCKHISRSESQAIRIFKNAYGVTPYAYVLGKKIDLAQKMLTGTNLSVKQIATKLCFVDEYYFSNTFKQKTGYTPTQYRRSRTNSGGEEK
jgi:AraC-like DNA-binding protein